MAIVGIDVGLDGGVTLITGSQFVAVERYVTPTLGKGKRSYDLHRMREILTSQIITFAWLERAQAMPGQGVSSMFSTGFGFGLWQGLLSGLQIPHEIVSPRTWQKEMFVGVTAGDTKAASAIVAQRLRPEVDWRATPRCRKPHDGLTDSFCIAEYGRRRMAQRTLPQAEAANG